MMKNYLFHSGSFFGFHVCMLVIICICIYIYVSSLLDPFPFCPFHYSLFFFFFFFLRQLFFFFCFWFFFFFFFLKFFFFLFSSIIIIFMFLLFIFYKLCALFLFVQSITRNPILIVRNEMALLFFSVQGQAAAAQCSAVSHKKRIPCSSTHECFIHQQFFSYFLHGFQFYFFFPSVFELYIWISRTRKEKMKCL